MKTKKLLWLITLAGLAYFVTSCASTSKAPASMSSEAKLFDVPDGRGTVFLYRTGRAVGAVAQLQVKVNTSDAGGTGPGTFFKWDLKPGSYTFSSSTEESSAVIQVDVKSGHTFFIRQDARLGLSGGRVTMKKVDKNKGKSEVEKCKLLVCSYVPDCSGC